MISTLETRFAIHISCRIAHSHQFVGTIASIAQLVERGFSKAEVQSSTLCGGISFAHPPGLSDVRTLFLTRRRERSLAAGVLIKRKYLPHKATLAAAGACVSYIITSCFPVTAESSCSYGIM